MRLGKWRINVYKEDLIGKSVRLSRAIRSDVTIIAVGAVMPRHEAADILAAKGVSARVIDIMTLKPIDREIILKAADETKLIVTAEDHNILGGLGGAVAKCL